MQQVTATGLVRRIRRWDLVLLFVNAIIGAGIFGLPSRIYALVGTYSLLAYLICALLAVLIVLCFAEVGSRFNDTGGPYLYAREAFGPALGFEVGWLLWLARLAAFAALCNLFIVYLGYLWPAAGSGLWRTLVATAIVVSLTVVNVVGVRKAALVSDFFSVGKLMALLLFVTVGLFFIDSGRYSFAIQPAYGYFSTAVLLLFFAFSGFEVGVIPAGETLDPRRQMPFAILTAIGVVVLLYILVQFVCIGTLPGLASSPTPLSDASSRFLGAAGALVITLGALISVTGTMHSSMLVGPRILFAMAEQRQLPRIFLLTHPRFHTPYVAILLSAAIMLALTLSGSFISALTMSTLIRLAAYAATCAALPVLRRKNGAPPARFRAPGGIVTAIIALALIAWLLSNSTWREARDLGIAAAAGLLFYIAFRPRRRESRTGS